jgi:V8-like Glu-specific endopeptidase
VVYSLIKKFEVNVNKLLILPAVLLTLFSCGKNGQSLQQTKSVDSYNIYGKHDRKKVKTLGAPEQFIGRLTTPNGDYCTASLVGKDLILTAGHCVDDKNKTRGYKFILGENRGTRLAASSIKKIWQGSQQGRFSRANDWALMRLSKPLGRTYGYFGLRRIKDIHDEYNYELSLAGYSDINNDARSMYLQKGSCDIREHVHAVGVKRSIFYHDCDAGPGDSGAPIYRCLKPNDCRIVAIHVSAFQGGAQEALHLNEYDMDQYQNVASGSVNFLGKLLEIRKLN